MPGLARDKAHAAPVPVTSRNARFQQWEALLGNRTKRTRSGEFVVHGVRPITLAVSQGWTIRALLHDGRPRRPGRPICGRHSTPPGTWSWPS